MNDTDFARLLRESSPEVGTSTNLAAHQDRILREARVRRGRRTRVWAASLGISALLVGGGSAAMAGAGMETPWGWVADNVFSFSNGTDMCFAGMQVHFEGVSADSDIVLDARDFVSSLDLESLDTSDAEAELRDGNGAAVDEDGNPSPVTMSEATIKQQALSQTVSRMMWEYLEAKGYPTDPSPVSFYTRSEGCNE